jgi:membrane-bound ClpP family serine protease
MELLASLSPVTYILFGFGLLLIVLEFFEFGFTGLFGALGAVCLIVNIFISSETVREGGIITGISLLAVAIIMVVFFTLASKGKLPGKLILKDTEAGYTGVEDRQHLIGKEGIVVSRCRPAGIAEFNGKPFDIVSRGEFIDKGTPVEVIEVEGNRIVVKSIWVTVPVAR